MGHVLEHAALEIQSRAGFPVTFGKTRGAGPRGQYHVVYEYDDAWVGMAAGELALRLLHHLIPDALHPDTPGEHPFAFGPALETLILEAESRAFGPSTSSLIKAAEARDIPWIRIGEASLVQFGHGFRQKRIWATVTSDTRNIAVDLASDKALTNRLLADSGLPVPRQHVVKSVEAAVEAFEELAGPVVVKPLDGNHGRGVTIGVRTVEALRTAFVVASEVRSSVIVESYVE